MPGSRDEHGRVPSAVQPGGAGGDVYYDGLSLYFDYANDNALPVGAATEIEAWLGIGLASAQELALLGANVTLLARNEQSLYQALRTLDASQNQQHNILVVDFTDNQAVRKIINEHNQYHILVNNTGGPPGGQAIDADEAEFLQAFSNHLINNQNFRV